MNEGVFAAVLAAGESTRIRSSTSKLLHSLCGKPVLEYPVSAALGIDPDKIFLVTGGPHKEDVEKAFSGRGLFFVHQEKPLGTGHAVMCLRANLPDSGILLVLPGDAPLIRPETIRKMLDLYWDKSARAVVMTARLPDPTGYGRVFRRRNGGFLKVIEHHDATEAERAVNEVCSGIYIFSIETLFRWLDKVGADNKKREYYLPGVLELIQENEGGVWIYESSDPDEVLGINTRHDLAVAHLAMIRRLVGRFMEQGVTFIDPNGVYLEPDVQIGADSVIYPWVSLMGKTKIGRGTKVLSGAVIVDSEVGDGAVVRPGYYEKERIL
ncbi:MAG: NTP transferase domain-containing protein [candidate division WOR-3 bacterium]